MQQTHLLKIVTHYTAITPDSSNKTATTAVYCALPIGEARNLTRSNSAGVKDKDK